MPWNSMRMRLTVRRNWCLRQASALRPNSAILHRSLRMQTVLTRKCFPAFILKCRKGRFPALFQSSSWKRMRFLSAIRLPWYVCVKPPWDTATRSGLCRLRAVLSGKARWITFMCRSIIRWRRFPHLLLPAMKLPMRRSCFPERT